jgi:hypothetical protein
MERSNMSNTQIAVITVADIQTRAAALQTALEAIQSRLEDGVSAGPVNAQTARLVGYALAKEAGKMLENIAQSAQYLSAPAVSAPQPAAEGAEPGEKKDVFESLTDIVDGMMTDGSNMAETVAKLTSLASEVAEMVADQFGVEKEAIAPMVYQTTVIFLPIAEDLVAKATAQLDNADALTAAATQS